MRKNFDEAKAKATKERKPPKKKYFYTKITLYGSTYEVHVLAIPILFIVEYYEYYKNKWYHSLEWSDEKATKLLDKKLGKVLEYVPEDDAYYYSMTWHSAHFTYKAPIGYRTWGQKFKYELVQFIKDGYENPNYRKTVEKDSWGDTWVKFEEYKYINGKKDNQEVTGERQAEMDKNIPKI